MKEGAERAAKAKASEKEAKKKAYAAEEDNKKMAAELETANAAAASSDQAVAQLQKQVNFYLAEKKMMDAQAAELKQLRLDHGM